MTPLAYPNNLKRKGVIGMVGLRLAYDTANGTMTWPDYFSTLQGVCYCNLRPAFFWKSKSVLFNGNLKRDRLSIFPSRPLSRCLSVFGKVVFFLDSSFHHLLLRTPHIFAVALFTRLAKKAETARGELFECKFRNRLHVPTLRTSFFRLLFG